MTGLVGGGGEGVWSQVVQKKTNQPDDLVWKYKNHLIALSLKQAPKSLATTNKKNRKRKKEKITDRLIETYRNIRHNIVIAK